MIAWICSDFGNIRKFLLFDTAGKLIVKEDIGGYWPVIMAFSSDESCLIKCEHINCLGVIDTNAGGQFFLFNLPVKEEYFDRAPGNPEFVSACVMNGGKYMACALFGKKENEEGSSLLIFGLDKKGKILLEKEHEFKEGTFQSCSVKIKNGCLFVNISELMINQYEYSMIKE